MIAFDKIIIKLNSIISFCSWHLRLFVKNSSFLYISIRVFLYRHCIFFFFFLLSSSYTYMQQLWKWEVKKIYTIASELLHLPPHTLRIYYLTLFIFFLCTGVYHHLNDEEVHIFSNPMVYIFFYYYNISCTLSLSRIHLLAPNKCNFDFFYVWPSPGIYVNAYSIPIK